jgi:hypothetical protein
LVFSQFDLLFDFDFGVALGLTKFVDKLRNEGADDVGGGDAAGAIDLGKIIPVPVAKKEGVFLKLAHRWASL